MYNVMQGEMTAAGSESKTGADILCINDEVVSTGVYSVQSLFS